MDQELIKYFMHGVSNICSILRGAISLSELKDREVKA